MTKVTDEKKYRIVNRSQTDRTLLIEHPNRTNQQFKLVGHRQAGGGHARGLPLPDAGEGRRDQDLHRQGGDATSRSTVQLTNGAEDQIRYFINLVRGQPGAEAEAAGGARRSRASGTRPVRELSQVDADLQRLNAGPGPDPQEPARDAEGGRGVRRPT